MLIPFSWKPEVRPGYPCVAFRWTFQINSDFVGFVHQHYVGGVWLLNYLTWQKEPFPAGVGDGRQE